MKTLIAVFALLASAMLLLGCTSQAPGQPAQTQQSPASQQPANVQFPADITEDAGLDSTIQEIDDANQPQ